MVRFKRCLKLVALVFLLGSALGGCVVRPLGWGERGYHDHYRGDYRGDYYYRGGYGDGYRH